jgi:hypothetical protein
MTSGDVSLTPGSSSYFSTPETYLDPNLFGANERLRAAVRSGIITTLYSFWRGKLSAPESWSTLYLAGSGASYQWAADRSEGDGKPGDLDVLVAIEWPKFYMHQPDPWIRESPEEWAADINAALHAQLWPRTAATHIGTGVYELTYYVNPATGPIQAIHPYAAYNITEDKWTVRPDRHPIHPQSPADYAAVQDDYAAVEALIDRYRTAHDQMLDVHRRSPVSEANALNHQTELNIVVRDAKALLNEIHGARNAAFSEYGEGYASNENFRWQSAKQNGVINALQIMAAVAALPPAVSALIDTDVLIHRALRGEQ